MAATVVSKERTSSEGEVVTWAVKCYCCGLTEECTVEYIGIVRERYRGRWICGLCAEAVKDERLRSKREISTEEAMKRHMIFCEQFRCSRPPTNSSEHLILAMKHLLLRSLESPSPTNNTLTCRPLGRSQSCFSSLQSTQKDAPTPTD